MGTFDAKLQAASRALEKFSEACAGAYVVNAVRTAFPPPALRLAGDSAELPLPITPTAIDHISTHADVICRRLRTSPESGAFSFVCEVPPSQITARNPAWDGFMRDILESVRHHLGAPTGARLQARLRKLLAQREGDGPPRNDANEIVDEEHPHKVGKIIVILPGVFKGGDFFTKTKNESTVCWRPSKSSQYAVKYAIFSKDIEVSACSLVSGACMSLVYDVINESPLPGVVQSPSPTALFNALDDFFDEKPPTKRSRGDVASAKGPGSHRIFVHLVADALTFDNLRGNDEKVANALASFCADRNGEYILYLARLHYLIESAGQKTRPTAILSEPWVKYGESKPCSLPTFTVDVKQEVSPVLSVKQTKSNGACTQPRSRHATVLAVIPRAKVVEYWANAGIDRVTYEFEELAETSTSEVAIKFARDTLNVKREWTTSGKFFVTFLKKVVELSDVDLFGQLLRSPSSHDFQPALGRAIAHFGWRSCIETVSSVITKLPIRSRFRFACSVLEGSANVTFVSKVLDVLTSLSPWSETYPMKGDSESPPEVEDIRRLLRHAYSVSLPKLCEMMDTVDEEFTYELLVPALDDLFWSLNSRTRQPLLDLLKALRARIELWIPALENAPYAKCQIALHCPKCFELQQFITSPTKQLVLAFPDRESLQHIQGIVSVALQNETVEVEMQEKTSTSLLLKKTHKRNPALESSRMCLRWIDRMLKDVSTSMGESGATI